MKELAVVDLESQVSETRSSLESALADIQEKQTKLEELERAKIAAEKQLEEVQAKLQTIRSERDADDSATLLLSVKAEVCQFFALHTIRVLTRHQMRPSYTRQKNCFSLRKDLSSLFNRR